MPCFMVNSYLSLEDEENTSSRFRLGRTRSIPTDIRKGLQKPEGVPKAVPKAAGKVAPNDSPKETAYLPFRVPSAPKTAPKKVAKVATEDSKKPKDTPKKTSDLPSKDMRSIISVLPNKPIPTKVATKDPGTAHESDSESEREVAPQNIPGNVAKLPSEKSDFPSKVKLLHRKQSIRRSNRTKAPFHVIQKPDKYTQLAKG
eukprot:scaffold8374_cov175-Amphora_coffeaeformis.AAC.17